MFHSIILYGIWLKTLHIPPTHETTASNPEHGIWHRCGF